MEKKVDYANTIRCVWMRVSECVHASECVDRAVHPVFQLPKQLTDSHEIWYERYGQSRCHISS
jgi:hypothetical protein